MKRFLLLLVCSGLACASNLKELLNDMNNNENILAKSYEVESRLAKSKSIKYKYLPSISLQGSYTRLDLDKDIILPKNSLRASAVVDFLIYDRARSSNIALVKKNYELGKIELDKLKNELEFQLVNLYYSYLALEKTIEYKKKNIDYLNASLKRLDDLVRAGLKPNDELQVFNAKVELENSDLARCEYQKEELLSSIYLLINSKKTPIKGAFISYSDEQSNSYDIQISKIKETMSELNKNKEFANFLPKIFIKNIYSISNNNYDYSEFSPFEAIAKQKIKESSISNTLLIGFTWNIFNFGADFKALEGAKYQKLASFSQKEFDKRKNKENLDLITKEIKIIKNEINANKNRKKASEIAFNSIAKKYEAGLLSYVEYLNALELSYGANAALVLSENKLEIAKAKLLLEKGIKIHTMVEDL